MYFDAKHELQKHHVFAPFTNFLSISLARLDLDHLVQFATGTQVESALVLQERWLDSCELHYDMERDIIEVRN